MSFKDNSYFSGMEADGLADKARLIKNKRPEEPPSKVQIILDQINEIIANPILGLLRIWFLGLFLALLFIGNAYVAVVALGAHQLQHKLREIELTSQKPVTVSQLKNFNESLVEFADEESKQIGQYNIRYNKLLDVEEILQQRLNTTDSIENRDLIFGIKNAESLFEQYCKLIQEVTDTKNKTTYERIKLVEKSGYGEAKELVVRAGIDESFHLDDYAVLHRHVKSSIDEKSNPKCTLNPVLAHKYEIRIDEKVLNALAEYSYFQDFKVERTRSATKSTLQIKDTATQKDVSQQNVSIIQRALNFVDTFIFNPVINIPQQMLTAVLVLAMGMLGGTVTMTRVYLDGNRCLLYTSPSPRD